MRPLCFLPVSIGLAQCRNKQYPLKFPETQISFTLPIEQPLIGFGTWNLKESHSNTSDAVTIAIEAGYRQIDGAAAYGNEKDVGKGIAEGLKKAGLKREDIWITSKLWNDQYVCPFHHIVKSSTKRIDAHRE